VAHERNDHHDARPTATAKGLENGAVAAAERRRPSFIFARFRRVRRSLPPAANVESAARFDQDRIAGGIE